MVLRASCGWVGPFASILPSNSTACSALSSITRGKFTVKHNEHTPIAELDWGPRDGRPRVLGSAGPGIATGTTRAIRTGEQPCVPPSVKRRHHDPAVAWARLGCAVLPLKGDEGGGGRLGQKAPLESPERRRQLDASSSNG